MRNIADRFFGVESLGSYGSFGKKSKTLANWDYNILETTPILHGPERLKELYTNANKEQKSSILYHISQHDMQNVGDWKTIADSIWDDFK